MLNFKHGCLWEVGEALYGFCRNSVRGSTRTSSPDRGSFKTIAHVDRILRFISTSEPLCAGADPSQPLRALCNNIVQKKYKIHFDAHQITKRSFEFPPSLHASPSISVKWKTTPTGTTRVIGNRKGILTRERQPKAAAKVIRCRYHAVGNLTRDDDDAFYCPLTSAQRSSHTEF